jgi:hypothetical protein
MKSLKQVAQETGGEFLSGHDLAPLVKKTLDAIRSRYLITYDPGHAQPANGCARISTELSRSARIRYPDAVVTGPRYGMGSQSGPCRW